MTTQEVLQKCTVEGVVIKLPNVQLERNAYQEVAKKLELIGGKWKGGKVAGFVFQEDPTELLEQIANGENRNIKKEFQFFGTPADLANELVDYAFDNWPYHNDYIRILEPSAGQGAIVEAIQRHTPGAVVNCYELMPLNQTFLKKIEGVQLHGDDFLQANEELKYDLIVANPPFAKNQDIEHIMKMWACLAGGGRIATIASPSWRAGSQKKQVEFREWLKKQDAQVIDLDAGRFKESGTNISTCIIIIDKIS